MRTKNLTLFFLVIIMAVKINKVYTCEKCGHNETVSCGLLGVLLKHRYPAGWGRFTRYGNVKPLSKTMIVCKDCASKISVKTLKQNKKGED